MLRIAHRDAGIREHLVCSARQHTLGRRLGSERTDVRVHGYAFAAGRCAHETVPIRQRLERVVDQEDGVALRRVLPRVAHISVARERVGNAARWLRETRTYLSYL